MKKAIAILTAILSFTIATSCGDNSSEDKTNSTSESQSTQRSTKDSADDEKVNQEVYNNEDVKITLETFNSNSYKMKFKVENKNDKSFDFNVYNITLNGKAYDFSTDDKTNVDGKKDASIVGFCQLDGKAPEKSDWNKPLNTDNELQTVGIYFKTKLSSDEKKKDGYKILKTPKYIESDLESTYGEFYSTFTVKDVPVNVYLNKTKSDKIMAVLQNAGEKSIYIQEGVAFENKSNTKSSCLFVNDTPYKANTKNSFNETLLAFGGIQIVEIDSAENVRKNLNISKDKKLDATIRFRISDKSGSVKDEEYINIQIPIDLK